MDIKEQRLSFIVNEIITNGQVDIKSIAKKLNVSQMTIYRDVDDFISSGVVRKEKGVLKSSDSFSLEYFHDVRANLSLNAKNKLVEEAGKLIKPNSIVALDDSTTCIQFLNFQNYFVNLWQPALLKNCQKKFLANLFGSWKLNKKQLS